MTENEDTKMTPEIKALLVSIGSADVEEDLITRRNDSKAGPGAGLSSVFFRSGSRRVRLTIDENSPLKIRKLIENDQAGKEDNIFERKVVVELEGKEIITGSLENYVSHCPGQAYITLCEKCIFDCKYCPVPKLQGHVKSKEEILKIIDDVYETGDLKAISVTSGVEESPEGEVKRTLEILPELKKYNVPIGVSVYPTENCSQRLYDLGVREVKYNVETMDEEVFKKVCPDLSINYVLSKLEEAVKIFGKNRVHSNFIIGLGETDESVRKGIEKLASIGVIPVIRPINPHPLRKGDCFTERPDKDRLLKIAKMEKEILEKYGLRPDLAETMCLKCRGCDMVPYIDL